MANTAINFIPNSSDKLPIPIIGLGSNYTLQHNRGNDINTFINTQFSSTNKNELGTITQDGNTWANDNVNVEISFADGNYESFLENKPMIFLELLDQTQKSKAEFRYKRPQWVHPVNSAGALNRSNTNYGGGDPVSFTTEWDFLPTNHGQDQKIEIQQKGFYTNSGISLPQRWVDFVFNNGNQLKWQRSNYLTPTGSGNSVINTFIQPIRFRFAMIDKDGRSVVLGEPSEVLYVSPKWGHFINDDDTYVYDWQIRFHK